VIRIVDRKSYLTALDRASIEMDIHPFTNFIVHRVQWRLEQHEQSHFPPQRESCFRPRPAFFSTGKMDEAGRAVPHHWRSALEEHFQGQGLRDRLEVFRANRQPT